MRILESFVSDRFPKSGNQSKLVKSSRACRVISYTVSFMLFNFQGTRPVRCSQRRIFILAHLFGFVKGFFFLLPKALPSSNPLPRPFFRSFGWVAASLFLSEAARLVYHIRRPLSRPFSSQPIFLRPGSGVFLSGCQAVWKQLCYNIIIFL